MITQEQYHLQLFMKRVFEMRELQKEYFKGNKNVLKKSIRAEEAVDNAIKALLTEFNYKMTELPKYEQTKLL